MYIDDATTTINDNDNCYILELINGTVLQKKREKKGGQRGVKMWGA